MAGLFLAVATLAAWFGMKSFLFAASFHFSGAVLLGVAIWRRRREIPKEDPWQPLFTYGYILTVFFPGFGALFFVLQCGLFLKGKTLRTGLYEDYESYISRKQQDGGEVREVMNALRQIREEVSFEPLVDILTGTDVRMKQRAIKKLSQKISRESVKLLQEATRDASPEVRLYAAAALLEMEAGINAKIRRASEMTKQKGSPQAYAELADLYSTYVKTGLSEETLAQYYLGLSAEAYEKSLDLDTNQPQVVADYARVLLALRRFDKAKRVMDRFVHLWPENGELVFLREEIYFNLGLYKDVGDLLKNAGRLAMEGREKEIFDFWTEKKAGPVV